MSNTQELTLKDKWVSFRSENPKVRIRDAARQLNSTEAELLATQVGEGVITLAGDFKELLKEITSLGHVMALTRNDNVVHERKGVYEKVSFSPHAGLVLGEDIDLRLFMQFWKYGFAVQEGDRSSLHFFDQHGEAVHKIYLTDKSNKEAYTALVEKYKAAVQDIELEIEPVPAEEKELSDAEIDIAAFQANWLGMKDTHEFFGMLKKHKVSRTQALRLAPEGMVRQVSKESVRNMLQSVAHQEIPIMVFVHSRGCIQIHTGPVKRLLETSPWYNIMDPEFNLHLREDRIHTAWVVRKPTDDGVVTALEVFDDKGQNIALFFGKRKPGIPEKEEWRAVLDTL